MFNVNRFVNRLADCAVKPACPKCGREIPSDDVNVSRDLAYCRACNLAHQLSTLAQAAQLDANVNVQDPPKGAWYREAASGVNVGATHRSFGAALGALAISLFWNGIVSIFVLLAISATLHNLDIPAPEWFPAPESDGEPIGPIGRRRRFNVGTVAEVRIEEHSVRNGNDTNAKIVIETLDGRRIKFGTMLREERMKFVAAVARRLLVGNGKK